MKKNLNKSLSKRPSSFGVAYVNSIKTLLTKPLVLVILSLAAFIIFAMIIIVPYALNNSAGQAGESKLLDWYKKPDTWLEIDTITLYILIAFVSAFVAAANALNSEKIYVLSKTISRSKFLLAKSLSALTVSFIPLFEMYVLFYSIDIASMHKAVLPSTIFYDGITGGLFFFCFISIWMFCSLVSSLFSYYTEYGITAILCVGVIVIYSVVFVMFADLDNTPSDPTPFETVKLQRTLWMALPIVLMPISIFLSEFGWYKFTKMEVES